ncbi:10001_t:CDS:10 [Funneliformis geosporum]|uniref:10001_t:CDS:1 n=1 Tax=Funneliformis geosporum TaxID=1117311 RepID=A0A9W4SYS6_9GLOM|nr:10001_t:CDS:10 [Funneliformis geosporum]
MYNTDHYFDFDSPPKSVAKSKKKKQQQQQMFLLLLLAVGAAYYFMIYLPEEEKKKKLEQQQANTNNKIVKAKTSALIGQYQKLASLFADGDRNPKFYFSRAATYKIYFPPSLREYYEKGQESKDDSFRSKLSMLEEEEKLILSDEIKGTGKTATMKNLCVRSNKYPLVEIKGSNLTPTELDQSSEILPLQKFAYTINEANQISNNSAFFQPNQLRFLKDYQVERATYRKGRLSNPLDFNSFIENNPNAQIEMEEDEKDEDGNPTGGKVKIDIEIAVKRRNIMSYDGSFESIKKETVEKVLDTRLTAVGICVASAGAATPFVAASATAGYLVGNAVDKEEMEREKILLQNQQYKDAKNELDTQINTNNQTQNQINDIVGKINGTIPRQPNETDEYLNTQLGILTNNLRKGESRLDGLRGELDKLRKSLGGNSNLMSLLGLDKLSFTDKQQLQSEIMQLEQNATNPENQSELESKKKQLKDLEDKQKKIDQQLTLTIQITILQREINQLTNKPTRTATEEALLTSKKKELEELLRKRGNSNTTNNSDKGDKTALIIGCGVFCLFTLLLIFILARNHEEDLRKECKKYLKKNDYDSGEDLNDSDIEQSREEYSGDEEREANLSEVSYNDHLLDERQENREDFNHSLTPELQQEWKYHGFNYDEVKILLPMGLTANKAGFIQHKKKKNYEKNTERNLSIEEAFIHLSAQKWKKNEKKTPKDIKENIMKLKKECLIRSSTKNLEEIFMQNSEFADYLRKENYTPLLSPNDLEKLKKDFYNAQNYLDRTYPLKGRSKIKEMSINGRLTDSLVIRNWTSLEKLNGLEIDNCQKLIEINCSDNQLTNLVISNCPLVSRLNAEKNNLTDLSFLDNLNPKEVTFLDISHNSLAPQDLKLGSSPGISSSLRIDDTNLDSDLEYLPPEIKRFGPMKGGKLNCPQIDKELKNHLHSNPVSFDAHADKLLVIKNSIQEFFNKYLKEASFWTMAVGTGLSIRYTEVGTPIALFGIFGERFSSRMKKSLCSREKKLQEELSGKHIDEFIKVIKDLEDNYNQLIGIHSDLSLGIISENPTDSKRINCSYLAFRGAMIELREKTKLYSKDEERAEQAAKEERAIEFFQKLQKIDDYRQNTHRNEVESETVSVRDYSSTSSLLGNQETDEQEIENTELENLQIKEKTQIDQIQFIPPQTEFTFTTPIKSNSEELQAQVQISKKNN